MALIQMNSVDEAILALIVSVALSLALLGRCVFMVMAAECMENDLELGDE